jgi:hypothetical protein
MTLTAHQDSIMVQRVMKRDSARRWWALMTNSLTAGNPSYSGLRQSHSVLTVPGPRVAPVTDRSGQCRANGSRDMSVNIAKKAPEFHAIF